jgi:tRNA pseudouridine38-40 synthase
MDENDKNPPPGQTWKLILSYDGTDFHGWQVQPGQTTVQGELQLAIGRITGESPLPQGSGRTDAGVHALAQVASFNLLAPIPPINLRRALNRILPRSIRILDAATVARSFHARHSAVAKTYEYRIFRGETCAPFLSRFVHHCVWPLDREALDVSARIFVGEQDFKSFATTDPDQASRNSGLNDDADAEDLPPPAALVTPARSTVRTISSSHWEQQQIKEGELLVYRVRGDGFLHHMVRNLVGTMLEAGRGQIDPSDIRRILAARSRSAAGPTAPARGLFLHSVEYE